MAVSFHPPSSLRSTYSIYPFSWRIISPILAVQADGISCLKYSWVKTPFFILVLVITLHIIIYFVERQLGRFPQPAIVVFQEERGGRGVIKEGVRGGGKGRQETRDGRQDTRDEWQEMRYGRQDTRDQRRVTRDERRETGYERPETSDKRWEMEAKTGGWETRDRRTGGKKHVVMGQQGGFPNLLQ